MRLSEPHDPWSAKSKGTDGPTKMTFIRHYVSKLQPQTEGRGTTRQRQKSPSQRVRSCCQTHTEWNNTILLPCQYLNRKGFPVVSKASCWHTPWRWTDGRLDRLMTAIYKRDIWSLSGSSFLSLLVPTVSHSSSHAVLSAIESWECIFFKQAGVCLQYESICFCVVDTCGAICIILCCFKEKMQHDTTAGTRVFLLQCIARFCVFALRNSNAGAWNLVKRRIFGIWTAYEWSSALSAD